MSYTIDKFERFPLSVILSFLTETEGTSFLLTRKAWCRTLLPVFRLPREETLSVISDRSERSKNRHKFLVVPVQDTSVRLARLNTRRWKRQKIPCSGATIEEYVKDQATKSEFGCCPGHPPLLRFLSLTPSDRNKPKLFRAGRTVLASYPRSGNTLLRSLLEATTGIVTGSDTRPDRTLSLALADRHDLVGEGVISPSQTPIVKTHWPERIGYRKYEAHRVILLVRNPFDAIDSYWNLNVTNTHTDKVVDRVYQEHSEFFERLVMNEMKMWIRFHAFWDSQRIPICWIRYEDLIADPHSQVLRVLEFSTCRSQEDWAERVSEALQHKGHGYRSSSSLDDDSGQHDNENRKSTPDARKKSLFGGSLKRYSSDLLRRMHALDESGWLEKFGYHVFSQDFPKNLLERTTRLPLPRLNDGSLTANPLQINYPPESELRPSNCPYGRHMRNWRRSHTNEDTEPFPTTSSANM